MARRILRLGAPIGALATGALAGASRKASSAAAPEHFDFLVIGGGSGGVASARRAAMYGKRVAIIERGPDRDQHGQRRGGGYGGTCVNVGCVPKKLMYTAAAHFEAAETAPGYGVEMGKPRLDWGALAAKRDAYVARLNGIYTRNLDNAGVTHVEGLARFVAPREVEVAGARYSADHVLIAVGGRPATPPIPGAEYCISSDGFFDLKAQPEKALVVGAGYIAVELAGILQALGSSCLGTLAFPRCAAALHKTALHGTARGLLRSSCPPASRLASGERLTSLDCVLMAIGRTPVTAELGLEATGVQLDGKGRVVETGVSGLYCLGDASTSGFELTPVAIAAGRRLADRIFGGAADAKFERAPTTDTSLGALAWAWPGLRRPTPTAEQAREAYGDANVKAYKSVFKPMHFALCEEEAKKPMAMKLVCAGEEERVVGLHVIGIAADEMLQGFAVAVKMGATKADFDHACAIHPTAAEEFVTMGPWGAKPDGQGGIVPTPVPKGR
ncbi:glutathione reductase [Emiliania huxleyi CCMP1516]|uniref:Glutathione-disulfide reductase n=2 Tax=Emiliania huxleyi TaxID=2903 RepID=A0A0D3K0L4_EMIH1|nr:glutathione reductase [Emiliania huxleyi CCMP1516]EOD29299.1 glutathione reductase [Emiliania huxleyi CCMP1516]|eukprot:XP_005781728.1 glutathione reductase [Emiliania huxleyi CCMP1516]